jgi:NitT/TauT family transport system permease protein
MKVDFKIQAFRIFLLAIFFAVWEILSARKMIDPFFFSQPSKIILDLWEMTTNGSIFFHAGVTLQEACIGFFLGAILGILVAYLLGLSPFLAKIFDPILMVLYGIPRIALAPLFILWFGLGLASKIVFAFSLVFFVVFFNTFAGLRDVNKEMVDSIRVMGASKRQMLLKVIFPSVIPWILAGLKSGIGMSLLGAIVGEYVGGNAGLGWLINYSANLFVTVRVFSCLLVLAILVTLMNEGLNRLERRLLRWRPQNNKF